MTKNDIIQLFKNYGWTSYRDEVGARVVVRRIGDIMVWDVPTVKTTWISCGPNVTNNAFDYAYNFISEDESRILENDIIIQRRKDFQIDKDIDTVSEDDIKYLSDQMIEWAHNADIEEGLTILRALPTDCLGAMPTRHLSALAIGGYVEKLSEYSDSFARGDRLGFVPYVDEGYIGRALDFARHRLTDPNWLPSKPKLRV